MNLPGSLAAHLDDVALDHADRPALISATDHVPFAALAQRSRHIAQALRGLSVGKGTRVGLLMPNRPEWLAIAFGVWRLGAVLVPINTLFRKAELAYALQHADVVVLIAVTSFLNHSYARMLAELCPELDGDDRVLRCGALPSLRTVIIDGNPAPSAAYQWSALMTSHHDMALAWHERIVASVAPTDDAAIFFTSGSTAAPKGVVHTHASMAQAAVNVSDRLGLTVDDRTYGYLPFFFNGGLVGVALASLWRGGAVLLQEVFQADEALRLLEEQRGTTIFAWPHQADAIVSLPQFDRSRLQIRKGVGASTNWAPKLYPPNHQALSTWGMTETGPMAACSRWDESLADRTQSHGWPMPGLDLRIAGAQPGTFNSPGVDGEMVVRGTSVMRSYYKMSRQESFDTDGFFHTGDCGHLDGDGRLHFLGRIKDVIKTAGVNVAAAEVEAVLLTHPDVRIAHVVPVPHPTRGENVAAFVVPSRPDTSADAIAAHCAAQLASYKVPRHLFLIEEKELPTLGSGKVDRQELRRRAAALAGA